MICVTSARALSFLLCANHSERQHIFKSRGPMHILILLLQVWTVPIGGYEQALDNGRSLLRQGQYRDAIAMLETVIPKAIAAHADATIVAIVLNDLAESYRNLAEYAKAEPLYEQALALLRDRPE